MSEPNLFGRDMFGKPIRPPSAGLVADKFVVPPFSLLDSRQGYWQERKRAWLHLGIKGEVGRSAKAFNIHEWLDEKEGASRSAGDGTSIFDPVLCELAYRWFSPPNGQILDPFAGGSVRGLVAGILGRRYHGIDLRAEQIAANEAQAIALAKDLQAVPVWICGDSLTESMPPADLVFSCPPYADLERYSDDPADLSTMTYDAFRAVYATIIKRAVTALRPDRFAVFVVGDLRCPKGLYRNFPGHTIEAFEAAGARLYNEAILLTAIGSLPLRINRQFTAARKLGKTHQNVLVFVKGDPKKAADACGAIAIE